AFLRTGDPRSADGASRMRTLRGDACDAASSQPPHAAGHRAGGRDARRGPPRSLRCPRAGARRSWRGARRRRHRRCGDRTLARRGGPVIAATPKAARRFFEQRCRAAGSAKRAIGTKAYLKSDLSFYGTTMPEIRRAANEFVREHPKLTRAQLRAIVDELWSTDVFELRSAGVALLSKYDELLTERDLTWLVGFVRRSKTWAHVDWLAADVIGGVV